AATLTLLDAQSNPIVGAMPTFGASGSNTTVSTAAATDANGQSTANYQSSLAQNENATVSVGSLTLMQPMTFVAGPPAAAASSLAINPNSVIADGNSTASLVTTARDFYGNPIAGLSISLTASGGNNVFGQLSGNSDSLGRLTTTISSAQAQNETITATLSPNVTVSAAIRFYQQVASAATSTLTASPNSQTADNSNIIAATLTLKDAAGNPIAARAATWSTTGTNTTVVQSGNTTAAGISSATYKTAVAQNQNIRVVSGGLTLSLPVSFVAGPASAITSTFVPRPKQQVANNSNSITTYLTLRDAQKNPVVGQATSFSTTAINTTFTAATMTDANGISQASYRSGTIQNANATVNAGALTLTAPLVYSDLPSACVLAASPGSQPANGNSAIGLTATVTNSSGQPVSNVLVRFSSTGGAQALTPNQAVTAANGQASSNLVSRSAGSNSILAQAANVQCATQGNFLIQTPLCSGNPNYKVVALGSAGSATQIASGDLNKDGKLDYVRNNNNGGVFVALGRGDGTFNGASSYTTGASSAGLSLADFDGDSYLDVAVANYGSATVSVLLNTGVGTFQQAINFSPGDSPSGVVADDFNGDGIADEKKRVFTNTTEN
ncbi:MAG: hypothetical protein EOO38_11610, partial [Cytophagaceae bacterium]